MSPCTSIRTFGRRSPCFSRSWNATNDVWFAGEQAFAVRRRRVRLSAASAETQDVDMADKA